jgi:dienelactone hydrolase
MSTPLPLARCFLLTLLFAALALAQPLAPPDRDAPGDEMIQAYLAAEARRLDAKLLEGIVTLADWEKLRPQYEEEYFYMLGLAPRPEKTPLAARVTGTLAGEGFVVEKLHYQSRPRLYVTGNLYRPAQMKPGERLPAVFYVCGHSGQGRNGNKTAYQSHGIWFARHGYVCLVVDSLQLGEIAAIHHGTYREQRWWWLSRGYTPAGVECLNGIRGIDYLQGRPDVDPERIAVTGISGGGAATFWIAAADPRVKVAVPVSGMADLESYIGNRVINGHCDCMFLHNAMQWPWTRIAALIAPRPQLFTNSDHDRIFPMDANDRVSNRLERVYSLYGTSDMVDAMVSIGDHAYRKDLRQAAFRFINTHLKGDPRVVADSETDLVSGSGKDKHYPIAPEQLRVFPADDDLPKDELNTTIDQHFVPLAKVAPPAAGEFGAWRDKLLAELRRVTFRYFPERIPPAKLDKKLADDDFRIETEPGIVLPLRYASVFKPPARHERVVLVVRGPDDKEAFSPFVHRTHAAGDATYVLAPRGTHETRWTRKNPPNYVERSLVLLGRTADTCRVWDVIAAARHLRAQHDGKLPVYVAGDGAAGVLAAYAALLEPEIAGAIIAAPPLTHADPAAPQLLNVLRVCDVPAALGTLAPRPLTMHGVPAEVLAEVRRAYEAAGAADKLAVAANSPERQ